MSHGLFKLFTNHHYCCSDKSCCRSGCCRSSQFLQTRCLVHDLPFLVFPLFRFRAGLPAELRQGAGNGVRLWCSAPGDQQKVPCATISNDKHTYWFRTGLKPQPPLRPQRAELAQRAGAGIPIAVLARDYGISRETVYQYLHQAKVE